ncbi:MAG TPA: hypothetical protein VIA10_09500 [Gaiellaceae bacterium]|jgi:lincosamide nucleotidyltransferase A/C/D/E
MDGASAAAVLRALEDRHVDAWVDGGWGVDALLGEETREHDDLDLVVELGAAAKVLDALRALRYELVAGGPPKSFVLVDPDGRQVDVHPVTFDANGGGVYVMDDDRTWVYPAQGFTGRGIVAGAEVRCLSPEVQVRVHAGYELTEKDFRELYLLRERFGVEPPASIREQVLAAGPS